MKTNDPRKILEIGFSSTILNSAHCKNTSGFGVLALPIIIFFPVRPSLLLFCLAWKLPLHAEKVEEFTAAQSSNPIVDFLLDFLFQV